MVALLSLMLLYNRHVATVLNYGGVEVVCLYVRLMALLFLFTVCIGQGYW
jgi:hypothetical protein